MNKTTQINDSVLRNRFAVALLLVSFHLLIAQCALAGTSVCGTIVNETWTKANSPYLVTCDVLVAGLTIESGVTVQFQGNYLFEVQGILECNGTALEPVLFTRTSGGWQGIFFNFSSPGSKLRYCVFSNSSDSAVRIVDSTPVMINCTFASNSSAGDGGAINANISEGDLILDGCSFLNNRAAGHGGGVAARLSAGTLRMGGCLMSSNVANPNVADGSFVGGGVCVVGNLDMFNCTNIGNVAYSACTDHINACDVSARAGGIYISGTAHIANSAFSGNMVGGVNRGYCGFGGATYAQGGGIYLEAGSLDLKNCVISDNSAVATGCSVFPAGGGVFVNGGVCSAVNVTFAYNNGDGIWGNPATGITNCISFFNTGAQIGGTPIVTYSDVQGGYTGLGNINFSPIFHSRLNLTIVLGSRCIDSGNPDPSYNDACFSGDPYSFSLGTQRNDMGAHGGPGACCWLNQCASLEIRQQPRPTVACAGGVANLCVSATGTGPLFYQWYFHGSDCANPGTTVPNGTNACLSISNVQASNAGYYSATISGPSGMVSSSCAPLTVTAACVDIQLYAGLNITGQLGHVYCVQYVNNIEATNWITVTNFTYTGAGYFFLDRQTPVVPRRFYRVVEGPCP